MAQVKAYTRQSGASMRASEMFRETILLMILSIIQVNRFIVLSTGYELKPRSLYQATVASFSFLFYR